MNGYQLHGFFLDTAIRLSKSSHCVLIKAGAVLVKDKQIIAHGINGTPCNTDNCDELFDENCFNIEEHEKFTQKWEISAEMNCLLLCAKRGISTKGTVMYSSIIPLLNELKYFGHAGIVEIVYDDDSLITEKELHLIQEECYRLGIELSKYGK